MAAEKKKKTEEETLDPVQAAEETASAPKTASKKK